MRPALVALASILLTGCVSLRPVAPVVDAPGGVRVLMRAQDDDLFKLEVVNYGRAPIVVDRDRVALLTGAGPRPRLAAAGASVYSVPPGGRWAVNVRFKVGGLQPGDRVAISLAGAVTLNGEPLMVPALEFVAD